MGKKSDLIRLPVPDLSKVKGENPVALEMVLHETDVSTGNIRGFPCLIFDSLLPDVRAPMAIRITVPIRGGIENLRKIGEGLLREADQLEEVAGGPKDHQDA